MYVIKNGTLYTMDGQGVVQGDIRIDKGKIVEIAPGLDAGGAEVIDASGKIVTPGFVDAHSHVGGIFSPTEGGQDLNEMTNPLTPELDALYGIDPGYVVTTETGDWRPGEAYQTKTKVDENEAPGTRYVKTKGADGRSVTVHRIVRDRAGTILHEEDFESNYNPINEVIVEGPNAPAPDEGDTDKDTDKDKESDGKEDARVSTGD